jgi:hypothetical protein
VLPALLCCAYCSVRLLRKKLRVMGRCDVSMLLTERRTVLCSYSLLAALLYLFIDLLQGIAMAHHGVATGDNSREATYNDESVRH